MISKAANKYLQNRLETLGSNYLMSEAERKSGRFDFERRLVDFEDADLGAAANCKSVASFLCVMEKKAADADARAHIYGYKYHAEYIRDLEQLQKDLIEMGNERKYAQNGR